MEHATLALFSLLLQKYPDCASHCERVADIAYRACDVMRLPEQQSTQIAKAALLHDIGKLCVPDSAILSPHTLTSEQWEAMRQHPVFGASVLNDAGFSRECVQSVRCHHERWDGSGYPLRLSQEQIPLGGRILAVCDSADAMRSPRVYRTEPLPDEVCIEEIEKNAGRMYDPTVAYTVIDNWEYVVYGPGCVSVCGSLLADEG